MITPSMSRGDHWLAWPVRLLVGPLFFRQQKRVRFSHGLRQNFKEVHMEWLIGLLVIVVIVVILFRVL